MFLSLCGYILFLRLKILCVCFVCLFLILQLFYIPFVSRASDQNGVSKAQYIVEIHHSGREPSVCTLFSVMCVTNLSSFYLYFTSGIFRVSDQNGVSPQYIIVEIYHSGVGARRIRRYRLD